MRCFLWNSIKIRRGSLGKAKEGPVHPVMPCQLGPLMTDMAAARGFEAALWPWKHFPNTVSQLWISAKRWDICSRKAAIHTPAFVSDFWMQLITTEKNIISQARGKALGDTSLTCSSHPREQQGGSRDLWGSSQTAEVPAGPQHHWVTTPWSRTALTTWFWNFPGIFGSRSSWWPVSGSLDYPGFFIPAHFCWIWLWNGFACCPK